MIYARVILAALVALLLIYYFMIIGQLFGVCRITTKELEFTKLCIPFYYWIGA